MTPQRLSAPAAGALWMIASGAIFTVMNVLIRPASEGLHPFQVVLLRNVFGLAFMAPFIFRAGMSVLRTTRLALHLLRAGAFLVGMTLWFTGLPHLSLMDANALFFTAPIFITIFAALVLGERVRARRWAAVIVGFLGAIAILRPGAGTASVYHLMMLGNAISWSVSALAMRALSRTDGAGTIVAHMFLWVTPFSILPGLLVWQAPSAEAMILIVAIGFLSAVGHFCLARAFTRADASFVIPFDYIQLIFAAVADLAILGLVPAWTSVAGAALIVGAALYIAHRESRLSRRGRGPR